MKSSCRARQSREQASPVEACSILPVAAGFDMPALVGCVLQAVVPNTALPDSMFCYSCSIAAGFVFDPQYV